MKDIKKGMEEFLSDDVNLSGCWLLSLSAALLYSVCHGHIVEYDGAGHPLLPDHFLWKGLGWSFVIVVCGRVFDLVSAKACGRAMWVMFLVSLFFLVWMWTIPATFVFMHVNVADGRLLETIRWMDDVGALDKGVLDAWWKETLDNIRPSVETNLWGTILTCVLLVMVPVMHITRESMIEDREKLSEEDGSDA